jgi:hypothetical protein
MYSMTTTPNFCIFFFLHASNKNTQNFTLISNMWKYLEKVYLEKVICQILLQVSSIEEDKLQFCTLLLPITFLLELFSYFLNSFEISVKF